MKDLDWELFDRYLAGQATPDERDAFERWLAVSPERAATLEAWRRALEALDNDIAASDRAAVWSGTLEQLAGSAPQPEQHSARPLRGVSRALQPDRSRLRIAAGLAAAAVLAVATALAGRAVLTRNVKSGTEPLRAVTVQLGERAGFQLPDGTRVMLAPGTTLWHPRHFAGSFREVVLEGEAYFAVEHDARRPFRVRAGDLIAVDRGTEFLVKAYPEDVRARVVVRSGEVAVRALRPTAQSATEQVISPGESGGLGADGVPRVEPADTATYFAWMQGTLVFDSTPLREALPQLSRWYNLEFRLADSALGDLPLSGRLDNTFTPARLDLLAGSLGLRQIREGRVVTFSRP
jgi:transmembrane sensor